MHIGAKTTMIQRKEYVLAYLQNKATISELSNRYGISRQTLHKWIARFIKEGEGGLKDRSSAHHSYPHTISDDTIQKIISIKKQFPNWGPKKIQTRLALLNPHEKCPSTSSIGKHLAAHGYVKPKRKSKKVQPYVSELVESTNSNRVWCIDFKGQFRLGNKEYCYPFTATDNYSRYLLACDGFFRIEGQQVRRAMERLFREYGLPDVIRSDNGTPFATQAVGGLSHLSIWWVKLGILPERIKPGKPQQNGRHERMHRTLKAEAASPSQKDMRAQQMRFDEFREEYNHVRPHEGIGQKVPYSLYRSSARSYPNYVKRPEYEASYTVRQIRPNGAIRFKGLELYIGGILKGEEVGMKRVDEEKWEVYFSNLNLGLIDMHKGAFKRKA